ncbi:MAG: hypothetical protein ABDI07_10710 [Candidatus Kryptonium sp.]
MVKLLEQAYEILSKYSFIPLGNSSVQNIILVPQEEYSVGRKLRAYYLKLWDRVQAAEENYFLLKEKEIELKKLERKLKEEKDELEIELIKIKIARIKNSYKYIYKLFIDCIKEINDMIFAIKQLPEINLVEFELQEFEHFKNRMLSQITESPQVNVLKRLGFNINKQGELYLEANTAKEVIEKRTEDFTVEEKYEEVKKLFTKPLEEIPLKEILDIDFQNMLPEPEKE